MKRVVFIILAAALAVCATAAIGQMGAGAPPPGGTRAPGMMMGGGMGICAAMALAPPPAAMVDRAEALQLTDDQKTKLKDILTKAQQTLAPLRQKAAEASRALREAMVAEQFDASKVKQLATDAEKAEVAVLNAEIQTWIQIRGILSADQVTKLQGLGGRGMRPGMGGRRGGGGVAPPAGAPPAE